MVKISAKHEEPLCMAFMDYEEALGSLQTSALRREGAGESCKLCDL